MPRSRCDIHATARGCLPDALEKSLPSIAEIEAELAGELGTAP
jgi:hypothetical protein